MAIIEEQWEVESEPRSLSDGAVHVWRAMLNPSDERVAALRGLLSAEEIQRAERFKFPRHQRRFAVARGILRELLGAYLKLPPQNVKFLNTKYGKPFVRHDVDGCEMNFNISHSHEMALLAFTCNHRIGVDVEWRRKIVDLKGIATHFFSAEEVKTLLAAPAAHQPDAFLNCWTRKEAYIKALGQGLSHPLNDFSVSLLPGEPARLLADYSEPDAPQRWQFAALHPHLDYTAALAIANVTQEQQQDIYCWSVAA